MLLHNAAALLLHRCRSNLAHVRQPTPYSGLGVQAKSLEAIEAVLPSLGSGGVCSDLLTPGESGSGDTTSCGMTGVTLHSHIHYKEI